MKRPTSHPRFELVGGLEVASHEMTEVPLRGDANEAVALTDEGITFQQAGWFDVLLTVEWDPSERSGHRFAHTSVPDDHPLHSEIVEAAVLIALNGGRQLLRGNTWFEPGEVDKIKLELWHDADGPVSVRAASLEIRALAQRG